jgi:electron transport complex protein RnfG
MQTPVKMIVVLSALCGLSGFGLSYLKLRTAVPIENQVLRYVQGPAILKVFRQAQNSPIEDRKVFTLKDGRKVNVFPSIINGSLAGVAVEGFGKGFGGEIGVIVGFDIGNDSLAGIGITTMRETPGLGTRVAEDDFTAQFSGASLPVELKSRGGNIDAVSGATVSSTGAVAAISNAAAIYGEIKEQCLKAWSK